MPSQIRSTEGSRPTPLTVLSLAATTIIVSLVGFLSHPSNAAGEATVGLGTAATYSVLGGQTVTNDGPSVLSGDLGVSPGSAITGFPPGIALGVVHAGDAEAAQAQSDLVIAYDDAAGRAPTGLLTGQDLGGLTLVGGVYKYTGPAQLTGTLTLDGQGNPDAVFIFQIASELVTATSSAVSLTNDADACNVFWQVGSSATLGTGSSFTGSILALTSISVNTGTTVEGRALARNGQVSLLTNVFTAADCDVATTTTDGSGSTTTTTDGSGATTTTTEGSGSTTTSTSAPTTTSAPAATTTTAPASVLDSEIPRGPQSTATATEIARTGASPSLMVLVGFSGLLIAMGGRLCAAGLASRDRRQT